jgi:putative transposase
MKLTLQLQLLPTADQKPVLLETMERFNAAASHAAKVGFEAGVFNQPRIHALCYRELRERFCLSSQMAVRAIGKAVEAFKQDKTKCPVFKPHGAITYDHHILSFKGQDRVSLWVIGLGRVLIPLIFGEYQRQRFDRLKGQVDLVYRDGKFYLYASIDLPEAASIDINDFLGVDLGIINLATDSDGTTYTGADVERHRKRHAENRKRFQKKRSKGTKKRLRKLAGREARYRAHVNHCISKDIVRRAKGTNRGIALEDLKGIRARITVRKRDRARHKSWAFAQLRMFVTYKAKLVGVPMVVVDPRYSSQTCSACGHREKANRKSQSEFVCRGCSHAMNADWNAALNLRLRARAASKTASKLAG